MWSPESINPADTETPPVRSFSPYLLVGVWGGLLVLIGFLFWYFLMRPTAGSLKQNRAQFLKANSALSALQTAQSSARRRIFFSRNSVVATSSPASKLSSQEHQKFFEQNSLHN